MTRVTGEQCVYNISDMSTDQLNIAMATDGFENEETEIETNNTKVSDSGYSNSCSNSQSQHSSSNGSKSIHSSSSGSSGYCGHTTSMLGSSGDENLITNKTKSQVINSKVEDKEASAKEFTPPRSAEKVVDETTSPAYADPAMLDNMSSPTIESEALQVAVLAQTLYCIQTKGIEPRFGDHDFPSSPAKKKSIKTEMTISDFKDEIKHEKEFCVVVTLTEGTVVCTTPTLTKVLGFPKDMWIGRSIITFMHPKDRLPFAGHITSAMSQSRSKQKDTSQNCNEESESSDYFYCWIRLYHGLKTGFNVTDKNTTYLPCRLTMSYKQIPDQEMFLVVTARAVKSAYNTPDEKLTDSPIITIRHKANTLISHVDAEVVPHFGYRPHEMIGRSLFDFYYDEDIPVLKSLYSDLRTKDGIFKSKRPYKFRCQNGDCVMLESEFSSFVNPWGKNLEFVIGRYKILIGPHNPDVISPIMDTEENEKSEEEPLKVVQDEITVLLSEPILRFYEPDKKDLVQLLASMGTSSTKLCGQPIGVPLGTPIPVPVPVLVPVPAPVPAPIPAPVPSPIPVPAPVPVPVPAPVPASVPEAVPSAASEMLGELSSHHVNSDGKSSSDTPSYSQLTYNENIQRFFASEPKTAGSNESEDKIGDKNQSSSSSSSGGEEGKPLSKKCSFNNSDSFLDGSGKSSRNSAWIRLQSLRETTPQPQGSTDQEHNEHNFRPILTEQTLHQHNQNMNKQMAQEHKKEKTKNQVNKNVHNKNVQNRTQEENEQEYHGTKRSVSNSWEGEPMKAFKGVHVEQPANIPHRFCAPIQPDPPPGVWPNDPPPPPISGHMNYPSSLVNPLIPCVYVNPLPAAAPVVITQPNKQIGPPPPQQWSPVMPAPPYLAHTVQYIPSLMYQLPLMPMVYTQSPIMPPTVKPRMAYTPSTTLPQMQSSSVTTLVKEEPGLALPSSTSASLLQELSDSSKKGNKSPPSSPVFSPSGFTSNTGKTKTGTFDNELTHDEVSDGSYNSMFQKTEKSDDSMKVTMGKESDDQYKAWQKMNPSSSTHLKAVQKQPSWLENVELTPDLLLRYKLDASCILSEVLQSDCQTLLKYNQPDSVNEQLDQLYISLEDFSKQLPVEESFPSCSSSSDEKSMAVIASTSTASLNKPRKRKRFMAYEKYSMVFEEDAPLPPSLNEIIARTAQGL